MSMANFPISESVFTAEGGEHEKKSHLIYTLTHKMSTINLGQAGWIL